MFHKKLLSTFILLLLFVYTNLLWGQAGVLDPTFGTAGKVTTNIAGETGDFNASAIQSDGKIVAVGIGTNAGGTKWVMRVIRYNSDGSLDNTFGTNGLFTTPIGPSNDDNPSCVVIQTDGKILVGGYTYSTLNYDFFIIRLNTNGTIDNTFGTSGIVIKDLGDNEFGYCMGLQTDGKIVLGGAASNLTDVDFAAVRYNPNGTIDNTFGASGVVMIPMVAGNDDAATALVIQSDGKIILSGYTDNGGIASIAIARIGTNGTMDNTFGSLGKIVASYNASGDRLFAATLQADGKLLVAGSSSRATTDMLLLRFTTAGILDNTFGTAGKVYASFGNHDDEAFAVKVQSDGKILIGGYTDSTTSDYALMRFTTAGILDNTFGTGGKVATDFAGGPDFPYTMIVQTDSKVVLAGGTSNTYSIARYSADAAPADAAVTTITVPASKCGAIGTNQTVTVVLKNNGTTSIASAAVTVNLVVSGANTGSYSASNTAALAASATTTLIYNTVALPNVGNNVFTATLVFTGDANATNNVIIGKDTAFGPKPLVSFSSTNASNTYNFTSTSTGKSPMTYKWNFGDGSATSNLQNPSHHYSFVSSYIAKLVVTDACGTDSTTNIITISTGIKDASQSDIFSVYPNPANNEINIKYLFASEENKIVLTDLIGNKIFETTQNVTGEFTMDVSSFRDGIYLLRLNNSVKKFMVKHEN